MNALRREIEQFLFNFGMSMTDTSELVRRVYESEGTDKVALLNRIGKQCFQTGRFRLGLKYLEQAVSIANEIDFLPGQCEALNLKGACQLAQANYPEALATFYQALDLCEKSVDESLFIEISNNIALLHFRQNEFHQAQQFLDHLLTRANKALNKDRLLEVLNNSALALSARGNVHDALRLLQKAKISLATDASPHILADIHSTIGHCYMKLDDFEQAWVYIMEAIYIAKNTSDLEELAKNYLLIARLYATTGKFEEAIEYALLSVDLFDEMESLHQMMEANQLLAEFFQKIEDFKRAFIFLQRYVELKDKVFNLERNRQMTEMKTRFETAQKEKESEIYRLRNVELAAVNQKLADTVTTRDKFFSIIAHDLKNPLTTIIGMSDLARQIPPESQEQLGDVLTEIHDSAHHLYKHLENLLQWARAQTGRLEFRPTPTDLGELIHNSVKLLTPNALAKEVNLINKTNGDLITRVDANMIASVIHNLLTNAIKFTNAKGSVTIEGRQQAEHIEVSVRDTGIGIGPANLTKLFRPDNSYSTPGTRNELGTGLGLILCKEFVEIHGGELSVQSTVGQGSTFRFILPS